MPSGPWAILAAAVLVLAGCVSGPPLLPADAPAVELHETPFFPQADYQCGPAALATVLHSAGAARDPEALVEQVYVPARQGSLQVELLAATRRAGRIPYLIDPGLGALRAELDAGRPVLVLQNLGHGLLPVWHYAVVIGLDPVADQVVLRSGTERRLLSPARDFLRSWRLADHWGFVVLRPGEVPAAADPTRYLQTLASSERHLSPLARRDAYQAALVRWPGNPTARFGLAYALHAAGDLPGAESAYRELLTRHPRHAAAYNNLAEVLGARGCLAQARAAAERALAIARTDAPALVDAIRETRDSIPPGPDAEGCAPVAGATSPSQ